MQGGLALLANRLDYVQSLVTDFQCGLIYDSACAETIVFAVSRFLDEPALLANCQSNAKKMAMEVFNWNVQSQNLFQTCDLLLKESGTAA